MSEFPNGPRSNRMKLAVSLATGPTVAKETMVSKQCAFTSGQSVGSGVKSADCRARKGENILVCCRRCTPGINVWRCSCCYRKFVSSMESRIPELEQHTRGQLVRTPAIDALLEIDWRALATSVGYEHRALKKLDAETMEWVIPCPSCYDFKVGPVQPMVPDNFSKAEPRIVGDEIVELEAEVTDRETGYVCDRPRVVSLRVISSDDVLSREQELELFFRAADPPEHDKYRVLWRPHDGEGEKWLLVRSTGWGGDEPKALSLIRWNALRGCAEGTSDHELGAAFVDCVRRAAGFHQRRMKHKGSKEESAAQSNKKVENVMEGPTPESAIRVNRVSGPFGHLAEGTMFSAARAQVWYREMESPAVRDCTHNSMRHLAPAPSTSPLPSLLRSVIQR